jgi:hypothetical protein
MELVQFGRALFRHWSAAIGLLGLVLRVLKYIIQPRGIDWVMNHRWMPSRLKTISDATVFWTIAFIGFTAACYQAWSDERDAKVQAEQKLTDVKLEAEKQIAEIKAESENKKAAKERRDKGRLTFAACMLQGMVLRDKCNIKETPPPEKEVRAWEEEVELFLIGWGGIAGPAYIARFRDFSNLPPAGPSASGLPEKHRNLWTEANNRLMRLNEFVKEIGQD